MRHSGPTRSETIRRRAKDRIFWAIGALFAKTAHVGRRSHQVRWRLLEVLNIYRLVVAAAAITIAATPPAARALDLDAPLVVGLTGVAYLLLGLLAIPALARERPPLEVQAQIEPLADLFACAVLVQAVGADLGILASLLVLPVTAAAAASRSTRRAVFFAALAALTVLGAALGTQVGRALPVTLYTEAGLFGLGILTLALIVHGLASRLLESEALAARRGVALRELDAINRRIIAQLGSGLAITDTDGAILRTNPAAARLLDTEARTALQAHAAAPDHPATGNIRRGDDTTLMVTELSLGAHPASGRLFLVEHPGAAEEQAQSLKLAALGRLTAGVAHQVRNPLGAIAHAAQLLAESEALGPSDARLVEIISNQSRRLDGVVEQILSLSRRGGAQTHTVALEAWLEQFLAAYREREPGRAPRLRCRQASSVPAVQFNPGHLEHIVGNLVDNAFVHADQGGFVDLEAGVTAGSVYLDVLDRGPGVSQPERLFEPFSTTRAAGVGLGLYLARELAVANGGRLLVEAREGGGSRFRLEFARDTAWLE